MSQNNMRTPLLKLTLQKLKRSTALPYTHTHDANEAIRVCAKEHYSEDGDKTVLGN